MKMKLDMAMESSSGSEGFADGITYEMLKRQMHDRESRVTSQQMADDRMTSSRPEGAADDNVSGLHAR